jgi:hypothetical protein
MNVILPLFVIVVTAQMPAEMTHPLLPARDASSLGITHSMVKQLSDMQLPYPTEARFLSEEE